MHITIRLNINNVCKSKLITKMHLCFVLFLVCVYVCVCECLLHNNMQVYTSNQYSDVRGPFLECRRPFDLAGRFLLPYYCAPLICVSAVIEFKVASCATA